MKRSASRRIAALLLLVGCAKSAKPAAHAAAPAPAVDVASQWVAQNKTALVAVRAHDSAAARTALLAMHDLVPNQSDVLLALAENAAIASNITESSRWLQTYAAQGLTLDVKQHPSLAAVLGDPRGASVKAALEANATPVSRGTPMFTLPHGDRLFEDIAWDAASQSFFITSVRGRNVLAVDKTGDHVRDFTEPEREGVGVVGIALDAQRSTVWLAEAPLAQVPGFKKGDETSVPCAVVAVDSRTAKTLRRIELPVDGTVHVLTDLAVTAAGDVVVSDSAAGVVSLVRVGSDKLEALSSAFRSPQTPAPAPNGRVYVPDYALGVAEVNLPGGETTWLSAPPDVALSGIDGLYFQRDSLIAVQNGTEPPRLMRLYLAPDGMRITRATVLEVGSPGLGEPTHGTILGQEFWFLASSGWPRFNEDGSPVENAPPDAPAVWKLPL